jgi:hypothetical protein
MALLQRTETGDTDERVRRVRSLRIEFEPHNNELRMTLDENYTAHVAMEDWPKLALKVDLGTLIDWRELPGNLTLRRDPDLSPVIERINSTASYQLMKAGIEIAEILQIVREPDYAGRRLLGLSGVFTRSGTRGTLFFPTRGLVDSVPSSVLTELVEANKLCRLVLEANGQTVDSTAYVPYATPITLARSLGREARRVWDSIREQYRAVQEGRSL